MFLTVHEKCNNDINFYFYKYFLLIKLYEFINK